MKHIHKFLRIQAKKTWTWTCTECSWFVHDGLSHVLLSKDAECWGCGDIFRMSAQAMSEDKPRCNACRGVSDDVINQMLNKLEDK
jgi:hypothetical protein